MQVKTPAESLWRNWKAVAPWCLSAVLVILIAVLSLIIKTGTGIGKEDDVMVRRIDVALPPPPPPPPPVQPRSDFAESPTPSVDSFDTAASPLLAFSKQPEMSLDALTEVKQPDFDVSGLNLSRTLALDFPVAEIKELDEVPRAISTVSVRYPSTLVKRGIKRVEAEVVLIIDQRGRAYIKKIVDPVYPEMIEPIRKWVKNVKFSIPTKDGRPIQAIYPYTIAFIYRV